MKLPIFIIITASLLISCATQQVSYKNDVDPIVQSECMKCHVAPHGSGYKATGLELGSYRALMQGNFYGPIVYEGDSRRSILNKLVEGRVGHGQLMAQNEKKSLTDNQIKIFSDWVNQGAIDN